MLNSNHPDDERLSALASHDADATADAALTSHLSTCDRCTDLVAELGALRASLAELPDLAPSRPLRLLPEVADEPARVDRVGGWARRFFAPVLTAGAALAMVGLIGTASPALDGAQSAGGAGSEPSVMVADAPAAEEGDAGDAAAGAAEEERERAAEDAGAPAEAFSASTSSPIVDGGTASSLQEDEQDREIQSELPAERSPWPMVLFTGIALMVAAGLLRWILAPRAS